MKIAFLLSAFCIKRSAAVMTLMAIVISVNAQQDTACACSLMDSALATQLMLPFDSIKRKLPTDSAIAQINKLRDSSIFTMQSPLPKGKKLFAGHSLSYNASYISGIEGVYDYGDILQQNISYSTKVVAFEKLPFNVTVFGRYTNSNYFRNYIDFNIDLSGRDLSSINEIRRNSDLERVYETKIHALALYFKDQLEQLYSFSSLLDRVENVDCLNRYIHYREVLSNKDIYLKRVESGSDSIVMAVSYIEKYNKVTNFIDSLKIVTDSISNEYRNAAADLQRIIRKDESDISDAGRLLRKHAASLGLLKIDTAVIEEKKRMFWSGFEKLSIGRTMPSSTELSFQNISVNGINTRYKFGRMFSVIQAGLTDFGLRDFVLHASKQRINNFVYNLGLGIEGNNNEYLLLSVFGGKQPSMQAVNSSGLAGRNTLGLSLSGQVSWKRLTLKGEMAQSEYIKLTPLGLKSSFSITDNTNKAYSISAYSELPKLSMNINGYYKYYGVNYYGFNAYRINAQNSQWGIQGDKSFFRNSLTVNMSFKTNDYQNPYVEQVYSGENTITSLSATFRKSRWLITSGYVPSYQYISIGDTIYENRYQVINFMTSYSYKIGDIPSSSSVIFNRFLNDNTDLSYFYGNSSNVAFTQTFNFNQYSSSFNTSVIKNNLYTYTVFDGSVQYRINKMVTLKGGFKINSLSAVEYESKAGGYGATSWNIPKVGALSMQVDFSAYPGIDYKLNNNTIGTIGFSTYFK